MSFQLVNVGISDIKIVRSPDILRTILGSCIGICFYDPIRKVAGLAHIMLPEMPDNDNKPEKYVDSAMPLLLFKMIEFGAERRNIIAKITGGSTMFKFESKNHFMNIGKRNIEITKLMLAYYRIPIVAEDLGGNFGRTVNFFAEDGSLKIKFMGKDSKVI